MLKKLLLCFILFYSNFSFASTNTTSHSMVVTEQHYASQVGADILKAGGNAIDAAIAVGYALAVVNPCCGNIGGGGFLTLHLANGKNVFLNFRERAPFAAKQTMFEKSPHKSLKGYLAVAVPGTVMGFDHTLKKYGTMTRQHVIAPAIQLAEKGFILTEGDIEILSGNLKYFEKESNVAAIFLKDNKPYKAGDRLIQADLANTLKKISQQGTSIFYKGEIASIIVTASKTQGGILQKKDFAKYTVKESTPLQCSYRGYTILSALPPSSGGVTLCEMLTILEAYPLRKLGYNSAQNIHYIIEAMRYAYADRNSKLGDPDFVANPIKFLLTKKYAEQLRQHIQPFNASSSEEKGMLKTKGHTTHYSVVDKWGNAVAVTYTLNGYFGAKVIAGNTGFFLNNEMDDFTSVPGKPNKFGLIQSLKNDIQPGKRPLSSMTPTIVLKNNKIVMVLGSPGGPRITTAILLTMLNVIDYGMTLEEAVNAPRFHHQWLPDVVYMEPTAFPDGVRADLIKRGYRLEFSRPWGAVEAIYIDPVTHEMNGVNDIRRSTGRAVRL